LSVEKVQRIYLEGAMELKYITEAQLQATIVRLTAETVRLTAESEMKVSLPHLPKEVRDALLNPLVS
jgi:hypothetical protein